MSIGSTIKERRKALGLTQVQLGEKVFKSAQVVSNWERGYTTGITAEDIKNISSALMIPLKNLIEENPFVEKVGLFELNEKARVPVIGSVRCGAGGPAYEYIDEYIAVDDSYRADEMRGFRAEGDSMEPVILDGDICLVHLQAEVPDGAIAVVVIDGEEGTIKCVHVDRERGVITLQPKNPRHETRYFFGPDGAKVHVVGQVVEIRRKTV